MMKSLVSFFVLAVLFTATVFAQDVSLFIAGVGIKLGMPKSAIVGRFQKPYDLQLTDRGSDFYIIREQDAAGIYHIVGMLWFKENRLVRASKTWLNEDSNLRSSEFIDVLYGILEQMKRRGETGPVITVSASKEPGYKSQDIYLRYTNRTIEITAIDSTRAGKLIQITEEIGSIR